MIYSVVLIMILYGIIKFDINRCSEGKNNWYILIVMFLVLISGLAYRLGGDGLHYLLEYQSYDTHDGFGWKALNKYSNRLPGWVFFIKVCRLITENYSLFKISHALIVNILIVKTIKRYSPYLFTGLLLYFVLLYFDFNFQILRQSLAIALFLSSIPYFQNNQWGKYYLITLIALSIHSSAIVCAIVPLIKIFGHSTKSLFVYILFIIFFILFVDEILIVALTSYTLDDSTAHLHHYAQQIELGITFSFFLNILLSVIIPLVFLYSYNKKGIMDNTMKTKQFMIIIYAVIYVMGLYIPIFYRLNHYFILFFYLSYIDYIRDIAICLYEKIRFGYKKLCIGFYFIMIILCFTVIKSRFYFSPYGDTPYPAWVQYYPYSSIIFETKDEKREDFFQYIN